MKECFFNRMVLFFTPNSWGDLKKKARQNISALISFLAFFINHKTAVVIYFANKDAWHFATFRRQQVMTDVPEKLSSHYQQVAVH